MDLAWLDAKALKLNIADRLGRKQDSQMGKGYEMEEGGKRQRDELVEKAGT